jgi:hypothetical protein
MRKADAHSWIQICVAVCADIDGWRETKRRNDVPCSGQRSIDCFIGWSHGEPVESQLDRVEQTWRRLITRRSERKLGDHRSCREPADIERKSGAGARYLE